MNDIEHKPLRIPLSNRSRESSQPPNPWPVRPKEPEELEQPFWETRNNEDSMTQTYTFACSEELPAARQPSSSNAGVPKTSTPAYLPGILIVILFLICMGMSCYNRKLILDSNAVLGKKIQQTYNLSKKDDKTVVKGLGNLILKLEHRMTSSANQVAAALPKLPTSDIPSSGGDAGDIREPDVEVGSDGNQHTYRGLPGEMLQPAAEPEEYILWLRP